MLSSTHRLKPLKSPDQIVVLLASSKLEDGDVKGAVRLLCSDDMLVTSDTFTFNQLSHLHPRNPADRRPTPTSDAIPLRVLPEAVKAAIRSFPSGSSAGPDGLRPHHVKDLKTGITSEHLTWSSRCLHLKGVPTYVQLRWGCTTYHAREPLSVPKLFCSWSNSVEQSSAVYS